MLITQSNTQESVNFLYLLNIFQSGFFAHGLGYSFFFFFILKEQLHSQNLPSELVFASASSIAGYTNSRPKAMQR